MVSGPTFLSATRTPLQGTNVKCAPEAIHLVYILNTWQAKSVPVFDLRRAGRGRHFARPANLLKQRAPFAAVCRSVE